MPAEARAAAGVNLGQAVVNVAEALNAITSLLKPIPFATRAAARFVQYVYQRWGGIPKGRRRKPRATLLVEAGSRYAVCGDAEIQRLYLDLLSASMDIAREDDVHPSFISIISELQRIDANILAMFVDRDGFHADAGDDALYPNAIFSSPDTLRVAIDNLVRMNLVSHRTEKRAAAAAMGPNGDAGIHRSQLGLVYIDNQLILEDEAIVLELTHLGRRFLGVCFNNTTRKERAIAV